MTFYVDYAAHVGHPISHSSTIVRKSLGVSAAAIGFVIAFVATDGAFGFVLLAAAANAARVGSAGADLGGIADNFMAPSADEHIKSGYPNLLLGPRIMPAARALSDDTKTDVHDMTIAEGSMTVVVGPEFHPMVRRLDQTSCGGKVVDGLRSVIVGGVPSGQGVHISEAEDPEVTKMNALFGLGSTLRSFMRGQIWQGMLKGAAVPLDATGHKTAAALLKTPTALSSVPRNAIDAYSQARTVQKGAGALVDTTSSFFH